MRVVLFYLLVGLNVGLSQSVSVIKFDQLEKLMHSKSEKVQVINFWATWCAPCVKELPLFEQVHATQSEKVKVTLISLDYADQLNKVKSFVNRKKIKSPVFLLDEIDYNSWIDRVDTGWQGAIPATLVINPSTGQRKFIDHELKEGELEGIIAELTKN
jgi:thiol-disulfide isomerase/thioredoxin